MKSYFSTGLRLSLIIIMLAIVFVQPASAQPLSADVSILFQDDFNDGDADGWTTSDSGTWYVEDGEYVVDMGNGTELLGRSTVGDINWTDISFEVDIKGELGVDKHICIRNQGPTCYYGVNVRSAPFNDVMLLEANTNPGIIQVVPYANTNGTLYHVKVDWQGANVIVTVNNTELINYTFDESYVSNGNIGLSGWTGASGSNIVRFDNVRVTLDQNIVINGSFEIPVVVGPDFDNYSAGQTFGGWTVEALRGNESIDHIGKDYWQAADGYQSVDLNGSSGSAGAIYQELPTAAQQTYKLNFTLAGNPEGDPSVKHMAVYWDNTLLDVLTFDITGYSNGNMGWGTYEYMVTATATSTRLTFRSVTDGFYGPVLDAVSVRAVVPDAFTYPMELQKRTFLVNYDIKNTALSGKTCYGVPYAAAYHTGEDWFAPVNTPVNAVADGIVRYSSKNRKGTTSYPGGVVILEHTLVDGSSIFSMYAHLDPDKILVAVAPVGQSPTIVTKGQIIAEGLEKENSGGIHLHWEMRFFFDGSGINKAPKYTKTCSGIPGPGYSYNDDDTLAHPDNFVANAGKGPTYRWTNPSAFVETH